MGQHWSFGRKLGAGFAVVVLLTVLVSYMAVYSLRQVVALKDHVLDVNASALVEARSWRNWRSRASPRCAATWSRGSSTSWTS
jgi:hypothetical protein